jgi:histidinol-phosphate aminotransferase
MPVVDESSALKRFMRPTALAGDAYDARHHDYSWQRRNLARLMSNEYPLPPSPAVIAAAVTALSESNLYPHSGEALRDALAEYADADPRSIVLGNGSTELLDVVARIFLGPGDEAIIPVPTYAFYETQTRLQLATPVLVDLSENFELDLEKIRSTVTDRTKMIFLCSPNNPTGNAWTGGQLRGLLELGLPVVVDQAYLECGHSESFAPMVRSYPNLIVMRTMSKGFGLAGLRIGYAVADPFVAATITRLRIPFSVSLVALRAATAALGDLPDLARRRDYVVRERERVLAALARNPSVRPYASEGNFVLIDISGMGLTAEEVVDRLQEDGLLLRAMKAHRLRGAFVRMTVGTVDENDRFLTAFGRLQNLGPERSRPLEQADAGAGAG